MRFFNGANWLERQRRRAVSAGDLIDIVLVQREMEFCLCGVSELKSRHAGVDWGVMPIRFSALVLK